MGRGPLEGLRVLDLSRVLAGPYCTMLLADLGADVVKVEEPSLGDLTRRWGPPFKAGESAYYLSLNRNKRSIAVDLKSEEGVAIARRLAATSDVVVENFRPGVAAGLGLGFEDLMEVNPQVIYCSISGYGQDGPYRDRPAFDIVLQAMGGLMSITGEPGGPPVRVGVAVADIGAGMFAAVAILAALHRRAAKGEGERIDVSILDGQVAWMTYAAQALFLTGEAPGPLGSAHPNIFPYQAFPTADGYIVLGAANDAFWISTCRVLGLDALADDRRYATNAGRVEHRRDLEPLLAAAFKRGTTDGWYRKLIEAGVPCGPVNDLARVAADPQVLHRGMVQRVDHPRLGPLKVLGVPMKFHRSPGGDSRPPPLLGEHTDEVLRSLGISPEEIARLRRKGVLA